MNKCWIVLVEGISQESNIVYASVSGEAYRDLKDAVAFVDGRDPGNKGVWVDSFTKVVDLGDGKYTRYRFKNISIV